MKRKPQRSIDELMRDGKLIDAALARAVREALRRHKQAGVPIVVWRNGKTIEIPPSRIRIRSSF
jgi:ABC-type sugar transport system substrate-binding protein